MEERWKPIKGYEGLYDVSSFGNVKSLLKRKVLKPQPNSSGYLRIQLNDVKKYGFQPSCVCNCCKGKRKTHKGYYWRYKEQTWGGD